MSGVRTSRGVSSGSPESRMTKRLENVTRPTGTSTRVTRLPKIGVDPVGREQVSVTSGMDVELKEHRRLGRTFKCDVESRFDQHWVILSLRSQGRVAETMRVVRTPTRFQKTSCLRINANIVPRVLVGKDGGHRRTTATPTSSSGSPKCLAEERCVERRAPQRWIAPTQRATATQLSKRSWIQRSRCGPCSMSSLALRSLWPLLSRRRSIIRCSLNGLA
jgi:hypothetical protein